MAQGDVPWSRPNPPEGGRRREGLAAAAEVAARRRDFVVAQLLPAVFRVLNTAQSMQIAVEHLVVRGNHVQVTIEAKENLWWVTTLLETIAQSYPRLKVRLYGVDYTGRPRLGVPFQPEEMPLSHHDAARVMRDYLTRRPLHSTIQVRIKP